MRGKKNRQGLFGTALVFAALATRSRPSCVSPAFLWGTTSRACVRRASRGGDGKTWSRGGLQKSSVSSGPLLTGEEALALWWKCQPEVSCGSWKHRLYTSSVRSRRGDEAEEAGESTGKEDVRKGGTRRRRRALEAEKGAGITGADPAAVGEVEGLEDERGDVGGSGGGHGKKGRRAATDEEKERAKARQRAERTRRITSTLDLVETLANSDVDLIGVLRDFSSSSMGLTDERELSEDDRLVGAIARPVLARIRRYRTRDAYLRRQAAKRRDGRLQRVRRKQQQQQQQQQGQGQGQEESVPLWSPDAKEIQHVEKEKPFPTTAKEIDHFLQTNKVTVWDAIRAYKVLSEGEILRRKKISLRRLDPGKWHAAKMEEAQEKRSRTNDPVYLAQKREERRLTAVRRYAVRRRNGNSGKGRPRSKADQRKAEDLAAARAAAVAAGVATEADFAAPPRRVLKKDVPTVKRRVGRPRKARVPPVEEERVASSANPSRGVGGSLASSVGETWTAGAAAAAAAAAAAEDERRRRRRRRPPQRGHDRPDLGEGSRRPREGAGGDSEVGRRGGGGVGGGDGARSGASAEGDTRPEVERELAPEVTTRRPSR